MLVFLRLKIEKAFNLYILPHLHLNVMKYISIIEKFLPGEGPVLTAYCLQPHPEAHSSLAVLQHYRIHGIRPRYQAVAMVQADATGNREKKDGK